ncbi:MAG: hypothetical protein KAQ75_12590, partial [Bacteroidales bacterium]|nr:hypothetical protein [Bacteroidales bacterium]
FIRNSQGQVLRKIGPNWVNGIGDWIIEEGYLVKMFTEDSFIIEGDAVDPVLPISLITGFQFVSYFPENPMDALSAFGSIIGDDLDFIRNSQGQVLRKIGPNWINGIGDCNPGEGYLVKMLAGDILIYPFTFGVRCPGIPTVTYEGQVYNTVLIGDQCWLTENLNIGTMIYTNNNQTDNGVIEKYCYANNTANCDEYGGLYQWNEMMEYTTTLGVQGICPAGWHLPTDAEWQTLVGYLGGSSVAGGKMKETGTEHWYSPNIATNESGFTALPGGSRRGSEAFYNLGRYADFWSATENSSSYAWYRYLCYHRSDVYRYYYYKSRGFSVRCVKD